MITETLRVIFETLLNLHLLPAPPPPPPTNTQWPKKIFPLSPLTSPSQCAAHTPAVFLPPQTQGHPWCLRFFHSHWHPIPPTSVEKETHLPDPSTPFTSPAGTQLRWASSPALRAPATLAPTSGHPSHTLPGPFSPCGPQAFPIEYLRWVPHPSPTGFSPSQHLVSSLPHNLAWCWLARTHSYMSHQTVSSRPSFRQIHFFFLF